MQPNFGQNGMQTSTSSTAVASSRSTWHCRAHIAHLEVHRIVETSASECIHQNDTARWLEEKYFLPAIGTVHVLMYASFHIQSIRYLLVRGGFATKAHWKSINVITLSKFYFRAWFLAQIVENRVARLSRLFLGPGDNFFEKVMTKTTTDVAHIIFKIVDCRWWVTSTSQIISKFVWQICFRHNS